MEVMVVMAVIIVAVLSPEAMGIDPIDITREAPNEE